MTGVTVCADAVDPIAGTHYPRSAGEFQAWFGTDADCLDYLEWLRWSSYLPSFWQVPHSDQKDTPAFRAPSRRVGSGDGPAHHRSKPSRTTSTCRDRPSISTATTSNRQGTSPSPLRHR